MRHRLHSANLAGMHNFSHRFSFPIFIYTRIIVGGVYFGAGDATSNSAKSSYHIPGPIHVYTLVALALSSLADAVLFRTLFRQFSYGLVLFRFVYLFLLFIFCRF